MSAVGYDEFPQTHYLSYGWGLRDWLLTTDHKRIAWLYTMTITGFFFIGGVAALLMRLELVTPAGDLVSSEAYSQLFSIHGIVMVWFFLIPSIPATLGNFLIPLMVGARDLAFPRINLLSWYIYVVSGLALLVSLATNSVDTGWTFYTPYSTEYSLAMVSPAAFAVFLLGFSTILTGLNFIVTIHKMRAPGMTWMRLPLFVWGIYSVSLMMLLSTPVLSSALLLVIAERVLHLGIFDGGFGAGPLLFEHLFWFYSHPAVYVMILPAMGVISELIACFSRNPVFGYKGMVISLLFIALLGFLAWGHHMFVSGQGLLVSLLFSLFTFVVAVPSAIKTFNWTATLYRGEIRFTAPMVYALSFVGLFTIGGLTGVILAATAVDVHLHDTYFVTAHFHYIMVGASVTAFLGGLHFWWPKMTGKLYPELWAQVSALALFIGFNLTFFPQFLLGYAGMPRRYHTYPEPFQVLHVMSTLGAGVLAIGYLLPLVYLFWSLRHGPAAGDNPWDAAGLEWRTSSPPPVHNFHEIPTVSERVYGHYRH